jgi:hypothetical protein
MARQIMTTRERIDQMLAQYATLEHDAFELIDAVVQEMTHEHRGVPFGIIKQCEIHNRGCSTSRKRYSSCESAFPHN